MAKVKNPSLNRALHHLRRGGLHRALHVPQDEPISEEKLSAAEKSTTPHIAHMARFARTLKGFKH
jgi:hypothetical protein